MKTTPFMVFQCKFISAGFAELAVLREFGIKENIHVMISFSNVSNEYKNEGNKKRKQIEKVSRALPLWEDDTYSQVWKKYYSSDLVITECGHLLVLDGNNIIENNILEFESITFDMILMIYHPQLQEDYLYKKTLNEVNNYYLTSSYKAKKNQLNLKKGQYPSICHEYSTHGGQLSKGCVVMYSKITLDVEVQLSY